ncbi:MAG: ABC transporter permease [Pseudomonadota bacterium]
MSKVTISPAGNSDAAKLTAVLQYRELIMALALRSIKTRFRETRFGIAWAFIQPLIYMLVLNFFFGLIIRFESEVPYPLYLLTALVAFQFFIKSISEGSRSISGNDSILHNIYVNPIVFPVAAMISGIVDISFSILILIGFYLAYRIGFNQNIFYLPLILSLLLLLYASVHLMMSVLTVRYKDIGQFVPVMTQLMFFGTPIFYQVARIPDHLLPIVGLNPMVGIVEMLRWSLLVKYPAPNPILLTLSIVITFALAIMAILVYRFLVKGMQNHL